MDILNKIIAVGNLNNERLNKIRPKLHIPEGWKIDSVVAEADGSFVIGMSHWHGVETVSACKVETEKKPDDNCRVVFLVPKTKGPQKGLKVYSRFGSDVYEPNDGSVSDFWNKISANCDKENGGPGDVYTHYLRELILQGDFLNESGSVARNRVLEYFNQYCPGLWGYGKDPNLRVSFVPYTDQYFHLFKNKDWQILFKLELGATTISFYVAFDDPKNVVVSDTSLKIGKNIVMQFQDVINLLRNEPAGTRKKNKTK